MSQQHRDEREYETLSIEGVDEAAVESRDPDGVNQSHPLVELFTPRGKVKILVALLRVRGEKLPVSDICNKAHVGRNAWYDHYEELMDYGVIEAAGTAGNSTLYRANMDSPIVELLQGIIGHSTQIKHELIEREREAFHNT